jgi:hypothetical protein
MSLLIQIKAGVRQPRSAVIEASLARHQPREAVMEFGMFHEFQWAKGRTETEAFDLSFEQIDAAGNAARTNRSAPLFPRRRTRALQISGTSWPRVFPGL